MFQGFSPESIEFLWGIRFNNERSWFQPRKQQFQDLLDTPMRELARVLLERMEEEFPHLPLQVKVSRIYRDARRLHGRGPYKDHLWLTLRRPGQFEDAMPCFYFELAPECYSVGMGCYDPTPATMAKLRARIRRDPGPLEKLARRVEQQEEFALYGRQYKRPKGDPGPLLFLWYNSKQVGLNCDRNCEGELFTSELVDQVMDGFRFLVPYYLYLESLAGDPPPEEM